MAPVQKEGWQRASLLEELFVSVRKSRRKALVNICTYSKPENFLLALFLFAMPFMPNIPLCLQICWRRQYIFPSFCANLLKLYCKPVEVSPNIKVFFHTKKMSQTLTRKKQVDSNRRNPCKANTKKVFIRRLLKQGRKHTEDCQSHPSALFSRTLEKFKERYYTGGGGSGSSFSFKRSPA